MAPLRGDSLGIGRSRILVLEDCGSAYPEASGSAYPKVSSLVRIGLGAREGVSKGRAKLKIINY